MNATTNTVPHFVTDFVRKVLWDGFTIEKPYRDNLLPNRLLWLLLPVAIACIVFPALAPVFDGWLLSVCAVVAVMVVALRRYTEFFVMPRTQQMRRQLRQAIEAYGLPYPEDFTAPQFTHSCRMYRIGACTLIYWHKPGSDNYWALTVGHPCTSNDNDDYTVVLGRYCGDRSAQRDYDAILAMIETDLRERGLLEPTR